MNKKSLFLLEVCELARLLTLPFLDIQQLVGVANVGRVGDRLYVWRGICDRKKLPS